MARMTDVNRDALDARQQQVYDGIMRARPRPTLSGPFAVWIDTPEIAAAADAMTNCFRFTHKLEQRLIELIILLMCRDAAAKYPWSAHAPLALKAGLSRGTVDAINRRERPDFERDDERLIYELVGELLAHKTLTAETFERATAAFGRDGVVEAVSCAGFYGMVGLVSNAFEIPPRTGETLI